jgi:hypothetical protein
VPQLPLPLACPHVLSQPFDFEPQLADSLHLPAVPQLSHLPSPFLSTKVLPWVQLAFAPWFPQVDAQPVAVFPVGATSDFVAVLAGTVVEATCEKDTPAKNTSRLKVKKILDAVFIVRLFL